MSAASAIPGDPDFTFDPFTTEFERDPYPTWRLLREHAPVYWWESSEAWVLTRHADIVAVMRDEERFSADRRVWERYEEPPPEFRDHPVGRMAETNILALEGAAHTRLRRLASVALTRRAVRGLEPLMRTLIADLLRPVAPRGECELVGEIASIYPVGVVSRLLGIPGNSERERRFKDCADALVAAANPMIPPDVLLRAIANLELLVGEIEGLIAEKQQSPGDDLMTDMLAAEESGDRFSHDEIVTMIMAILVAGSETTANSMALGLFELLRHPEQLARFRDDPAIRPNAVYEIVRYQMPGRFLNRYAKVDATVAGVQIHKGQLLLCSIPSAQRDPEAIPAPDRFDIGRKHVDQTAFGIGRHFCLGAQLARLELEISLGAILETLPGLRLGCAPEDVPFRPHPTVRGIQALPLRFDPVAV
jgi:cytochrome P450